MLIPYSEQVYYAGKELVNEETSQVIRDYKRTNLLYKPIFQW